MHRKLVIRKSIIILNMFAVTSVRSKELAINVKNMETLLLRYNRTEEIKVCLYPHNIAIN